MTTIKPKERDAIIHSLRAGVVPRIGQHLIQVGRAREVESLLRDINRVSDGGSAFRLIVGEYGAGKTFFLNLMRSVALEKKLVTMHADLNPGRRLHGTSGQARSLYAELTHNLSTRMKPEGGALAGLIERFISQVHTEATANDQRPDLLIRQKLGHLSEMVNGFDFAEVICAYCDGFEQGNEQVKADAIRWLRGEFVSKIEARRALGVRSIVDDASIYDQIKLLASFVRLAGYAGLMVCMDEMVNLYKISHTQTRNANYEQVLRILNDILQGNCEGLGVLLGGTPEFLYDTRRGLYSYPALQTRLAENAFANSGLVDYSGTVLRLSNLSPEEFFILLQKLRHLYAMGDPACYLIPDDGLSAFMEHCAKRLGNDYFRTPRTTITSFLDLLAVIEQNPGTDWRDLVGTVKVQRDMGGEADQSLEPDEELASFRL